jgi:hypothetical protein
MDEPNAYTSDSDEEIIETEYVVDVETWIDINSEALLDDWLYIRDEIFTIRTFNEWAHFVAGELTVPQNLVDPPQYFINMWISLKIPRSLEDFYNFLH